MKGFLLTASLLEACTRSTPSVAPRVACSGPLMLTVVNNYPGAIEVVERQWDQLPVVLATLGIGIDSVRLDAPPRGQLYARPAASDRRDWILGVRNGDPVHFKLRCR